MVTDIEQVLEGAAKKGLINNADSHELEGTARIVLALYHGLAVQVIHDPQIMDNEQIYSVR